MLAEVISNMTSSLQRLTLDYNEFSSVSFEKLVTKIAECGVCSTLKVLDLHRSANFDSDESIKKFADILAIAPVLKVCNFRQQRGNRKVKVEVQYATEERKGAIVIQEIWVDGDGYIIGEQEIYRRETKKQQAQNKMKFFQ